MDLNPVAFAPSATIPHIPNTERKDTLKIYGDAPVTVSDVRVKVAPVVLEVLQLVHFELDIQYQDMSLHYFPVFLRLQTVHYILQQYTTNTERSSTSKPDISVDVLTVILVVGVTPSPALILEIPADTPVEPTILNSSILG
ncbi:MAG: hypothetical protein CM15mV12_3080 [uncultured marine virus]|nr:MAG: hypothetical protein CM15mV12_3080 [uncultured marine virus]